MTFTSFYEQPLRQIFAEAAEINRRSRVSSRNPVTSAAPKKAFSNAPAKVAQLNTNSTVHKVVDSSLAGIDGLQRQIKVARSISNVTSAPIVTLAAAPGAVEPREAVIDQGLERIKAAHSPPLWVAPVVTISAAPVVVEPQEAVIDRGLERIKAAHSAPLPSTPIGKGLAVPVIGSQRSSVDRGLERIKAAHSPPPPVASVKATQAILVVEPQAAAPKKVVPIESVKFAQDGNIKTGVNDGLDRIKAACSSSDVPVTPTLPINVCKFFLSRNGCKYEDNCPSFHDYDALIRCKEQWAASDAKKLEQVRSNQQLAYTQKVLALKSNNAKVSIVVATPSKSSLKETTKKRSASKGYRSPRGYHRKHCLFSHENLPSEEPEKLIDDTIPGEVQIPKCPKAMLRKRKASKASKAPVVKVTEPEPEATLPVLKPIVWANNPYLGDEDYCDNAIWQIFGKPCPTKEEAIKWCQEMQSNGNFKHFTLDDIIRWARAMDISDRDEFLTHIGYIPGILERFEPRVQLYIERLRAKYDAEEARPKYDTFHCFGKLPPELCLKIWGFAARTGRTLTVSLNKKQIHTSEGPGIFIRQLGSGGSPLWYVNKQSQAASMMDKYCGYYFGCDYFSPRFDTLFLNDSAASLNLFTSQIALWRGNVIQRLSFPHYQLCNVTYMPRFAADLLEAFPSLIRIEFWLSDGDYYSKYLKKSASVIQKANTAIAQAYGVRVGVKPPRVRFAIVPEERALEIGIGGGLW
ncbi:hypothetical protein OCU04_008236 [Sclerotinia nivalis]|uniref:C3H1-type domain-containing protein n=1 Tax=Sclerotinia nivalis TaxID=352851 RepID=A0A9X0AHP3_9HELO|nr:hypothetical protein OCU04_008236 [Sclerotinia nivalis]